MARGTHTQGNFLGGMWGTDAQGRLDDPSYPTACENITNFVCTEGGALTRRGGKRMCGPTRQGQFATVYSWDTGSVVYDVEITCDGGGNSFARFWLGDQPVLDTDYAVSALSTSSPTTMTVAATTWSTGDTIMVNMDYASLTGTVEWAPVLNRQMLVTKGSTTSFTLTDALTGAAINGAGFVDSLPTTSAARIMTLPLLATTHFQLEYASFIEAMVDGVSQLIICQANVPPQVITYTPPSGGWPGFTASAFPFTAGPYRSFSTAYAGSISASSGTANFYAQFPQWLSGAAYGVGDQVCSPAGSSGINYVNIAAVQGSTPPASDPTHWAVYAFYVPNNATGFVASDVGRSFRIYSQPGDYDPAASYVAGDAVFWDNQAYTCLAATSMGLQPDQNPVTWAVAPTYLVWVDATIVAVISGNEVTLDYGSASIPSANGSQITYALESLYNTVFDVWPTAGAFHEGRLWFVGAVPNQLDGSEVGLTTFRPTDSGGNVLDDSAIQEPLLSSKSNPCYWLASDQGGLIVGMKSEEWLCTATSAGQPLTPANFQAHRVSSYGSLPYTTPVWTGMALAFIHKNPQELLEYVIDVFSSKPTGVPLNDLAKSVTGPMNQVIYNNTPDPVVWVIGDNNNLIGCTYRRISRFVSEPPKFRAWHQHVFAGKATLLQAISRTSVVFTPHLVSGGVYIDSVAMVTFDGTYYYRELMQSTKYVSNPDETVWCLDGSVSGAQANTVGQAVAMVGLVGTEDGTNMYFSGLWYQPSTVRVYLAGIDFGTFPVTNGSITVPYASDPTGIGTRAYLVANAQNTWVNGVIPIKNLGLIPGIIGSSYNSVVKPLRPDTQGQARTEQGTAAGQFKSVKQAAALIGLGYNGSATVQYGNNTAYPMVFRQYVNGPGLAPNAPFVGVWRDVLEASFDYDGQTVITVSGPYPFILNSVTPFQETSEQTP